MPKKGSSKTSRTIKSPPKTGKVSRSAVRRAVKSVKAQSSSLDVTPEEGEMTKLYYTNPLAAAVMAKEFGVQYSNKFLYGGEIGYNIENQGGFGEDIDKFYIHPDSYHIFEPQEGDIILALEEKAKKITSDEECKNLYGGLQDDEVLRKTTFEKWLIIGDDKIIQRNDKPFFTPEREDEVADAELTEGEDGG